MHSINGTSDRMVYEIRAVQRSKSKEQEIMLDIPEARNKIKVAREKIKTYTSRWPGLNIDFVVNWQCTLRYTGMVGWRRINLVESTFDQR